MTGSNNAAYQVFQSGTGTSVIALVPGGGRTREIAGDPATASIYGSLSPIEVGPDGTGYLLTDDGGTTRVLAFSPNGVGGTDIAGSGTPVPAISAGGLAGYGLHPMTFDSSGNAHVVILDAGAQHAEVWRFSAGGSQATKVFEATDVQSITAVTTAPDGSAYVSVGSTGADGALTTVHVVSASPSVL